MRVHIYQFFQVLPGKLREEDKRQHFVWSFWLMVAAQLLWSATWAFAAVFLIGLAKEFWDMRYGSGFCFFDISANLLGSTAALLLGLSVFGFLLA